MTENDAGRRPPGPPPSWLGAGLPTAPIPSGAAEQNESPEEVRPAGRARGTMGRVGNVIGALVAVTALVAIVFVFGRPYVAQWFGGGGESSPLGEGGVYDFTQDVSSEAPIGGVDSLTVLVPDGLSAEASSTYGLSADSDSGAISTSDDGSSLVVPLHAVSISNARLVAEGQCSVDLAFEWSDMGALTDPTSVLVRDTTVTIQMLNGEEPMATEAESFAQFSEDYSTATATVDCFAPGQTGSGDRLNESSFVVEFGFMVPTATADVAAENRVLARAPIRVRDDGSLFVTQQRVNDTDRNNVPLFTYWPDSQAWSVRD